jgi:hypothetical protein
MWVEPLQRGKSILYDDDDDFMICLATNFYSTSSVIIIIIIAHLFEHSRISFYYAEYSWANSKFCKDSKRRRELAKEDCK